MNAFDQVYLHYLDLNLYENNMGDLFTGCLI